MDLEKVRVLNKKQLLEKLEQNGLDLVANILRDKEINGEKLLELTEFETIKWRLPLSQKKMLFNCINDLKKNPSTILNNPTTPKPKYGASKAPPPKPTRIQQKEPPLLNPKPRTSNFSEDQTKIAFKQKLGTLFEGSFEFKPVSAPRPPGSSGQAPSDEIPTPPRFRNLDSTQHKASYPDPVGFDNQGAPSNVIPTPPRIKKFDDTRQIPSYIDPPNDHIPARRDVNSEAKLPLPTPKESKITTKATSPLKASTVKNKRKLPLPVEPQRPVQANTPPRPKTVDSGKTRTVDNKTKPLLPPPMKTQAPIPTRSINATGCKGKLPVPSLGEPQTAQRKPALLPSNKCEFSPIPPKKNTVNSEKEEMYVDICKQLENNYGYLSPIDLAASRSGSPFSDTHVPPFLPPRNASPNFPSHEPDEEEPTYHDPDEMYEQPPKLNSFDNAPNIPSAISRKLPSLSTKSVDNGKITMETRSRNLDSQNRVTIDRNDDKQGNGFLKKLFKIKGKLIYENVEIQDKMEHRVSVSDKIQPRPLPPVPRQDAPPSRGEIPLGDPAGYIELTLQRPDIEELYANYEDNAVKILVDESEEANYSNTQELQSRPHNFTLPLSSNNTISKQSPDDLAAKLAQDLKARIWHSKEQSDDTDGSDFERDPEDEEISEQTYSNAEIEDSRALASKSPFEINKSVDTQVTEQQKHVKETAINRNNQQIFSADENLEEIYINLPDSSSNIWNARSIPIPPVQINKTVTTEKRNRGILNYSSLQFNPVKNNSHIEVEKEEDSTEQVYGNIEAEISYPEKSQENSIFQISNEPYYRDTDRRGAKKLLRSLGNGAFLFRPSEKHFLVLSAKHNGKFYNFGIERSPNGKIRLTADTNSDVPEFSSLKEFVEYFSREALTFQEETSLAEIYLSPVLPHDVS